MGFLRRFRNYFLTGLVVSAPIGITAWLAWWFVSLFDAWVKPFIPSVYNPDTYLPFTVPGVGLLAAILGIALIGALAANLVGRTILGYWEILLDRMPVIRSVYKAMKQIFQTAFSQESATFEKVGLIEYPRRGVHVVVFIARALDSGEIGLEPGHEMVACFMPTTPNPTSGFLFFVFTEEVRILDLSVEEGAKLVISAGLVTRPGVGNGEMVEAIDDETVASLIRKKKVSAPARKPARKKAAKKSVAKRRKVSRRKAT
ncbi:MAG: DUF502 domain-containing protein [Hyphomicrobiales bacterium]|nr:DUF502 domain-containing protein [Hyphomicrobiales bacterium]